MTNYNYQISTAKIIFDKTISCAYDAVVLAAAPNSGKSTIIIEILNLFFQQFPDIKVVVLTHNQNLLKDQMLESFRQGFVKPKFTFGEFGSDSQVEVGIPSSRSKITGFDVLVVDEAHQYYKASMVEEIKEKFKPRYEILMTGSPSIYNQANQQSNKLIYGIHYISGEELVENNVYSDIVIDVVQSGKDVIENYKKAYDKLKEDKRFNDSKLMIACKTIDDAYILGNYLKTIGRKIAISTSDNDSKNLQIKRFKSGEADTLLVVNKGILGFSDNNVTALIDLKSSKDIDTRNQLFARILRKHPDGIKKFYISTATKSGFNKEVELLYKVANLMKKEVFQTYVN